VLISENLYNKEFVDKYTNFAQFERQIREHFQRYTPEWAEGISGIPAADTRRIAREFGSRGPAIVPAHKKTLCANYANASQLMQAITILNILAGTVDRPGGRYFARAFSVPGVDAVYPPPAYPARTGRRVDGKDKLPFVLEDGGGMFSTLADGVLNKFPGMVKFGFVNAYTALGFPQPKQMEEALRSIPFLVTMDVLPTDTVMMSDIALPSAMYLEVNDIVTREYNAKYPQAVPRVAVAPPIFEARGAAFVALELGKRLTPDYFKLPNGEFINTNTLLDEKTRRAGLGENFAEFRTRGLTTRQAPFVPRETFATPGNTGKCQIYVPQFAERSVDPLPVWKPKRDEPNAQYPYYLLTFIPAVHKRNSTQNNKILNEMMGTNDVQIPTAIAARLGIREGDL
ncbi:MAG: molybdopterin-dependent oxidoreductase, partial [Bryobacterales bacterium]|nr:molybdopterin-dependent oxidoreductase [Bryobacterales bacterium]